MPDHLFDYSLEQINAVETAISFERLGPYMIDAGGNKLKALKRYERNTQLSEALYGPLQGVEIVARNAFHTQLSKQFGPAWFIVLEQKNILKFGLAEKLNFARKQLQKNKKPETAGRIVAELSFGFWTGICAPRYLRTLWNTCLNRSFNRLPRDKVFNRLDSIRDLRNRVAHHEPILARDLESDFDNILEAIGWICGASASWIESTSCFRERFAQRPSI